MPRNSDACPCGHRYRNNTFVAYASGLASCEEQYSKLGDREECEPPKDWHRSTPHLRSAMVLLGSCIDVPLPSSSRVLAAAKAAMSP